MSKVLFTLLLIFVSVPKRSLATATGDKQTQVEKLFKKHRIDLDEISLLITDADQKVIASINPQQMRIPASISKVATALAVLKSIPPGTKVKTQLRASASPEGQVLAGDLCLVGGGDPGFVSETLWQLVNNFIRSGIKKIEGHILVDDQLFDNQRFDNSRQDARVDRAYDAPVGAMSFNWNSVNVFLRPGNKTGDPGLVFLDPSNDYTQLNNKLRTGKTTNYTVERETQKGVDTITVSGSIANDSKELVAYKSISQPDLWSAANLLEFLKQRGVTVSGKIQRKDCRSFKNILAEVDSKPVELMVADMNKFSNNYVAEMLTKLTATQLGKSGTIANGIDIIQATTKACGASSTEMQLQNPSGLTRDNKLTAQAMHKLLVCIQKDLRIFPEFLASLPIGGVDGTLKNRFKATKTHRWVRAKTGLLTGVTALAGYAGAQDGALLTFVLIQNGKADGALTRQVFDDVIATAL